MPALMLALVCWRRVGRIGLFFGGGSALRDSMEMGLSLHPMQHNTSLGWPLRLLGLCERREPWGRARGGGGVV